MRRHACHDAFMPSASVCADLPRFVKHVDEGFLAQVTELYRQRIPEGGCSTRSGVPSAHPRGWVQYTQRCTASAVLRRALSFPKRAHAH
eukprot:102276-Chlamydomonas_euryale.AAC.2